MAQEDLVTPGSVTTNQTGGVGTPVQVENIQYNVKVGKVRSKIGLATFVMALVVWVIALMLGTFVLMLRSLLLPLGDPPYLDFASSLVLLISFLVPLAPLLWYTRKRIREISRDNPGATDDAFFKKTIQLNLILSIPIAVIWTGIATYNLLALFLLPEEGVLPSSAVDGVIFAAVSCGLVYYFYSYQRLTKR